MPTHSVAGGRGGEGRKGGLVRRMLAEANIRKVGTIRGGGDAPSQCRWPIDGQRSRLLVLQAVAAPVAAAAVRWTTASRVVD